MHRPYKIISGGQTGADIGGLVGARRAGILTGGCAPHNFKTEKGNQEQALRSFGLYEHDSGEYGPRTIENIIESDATIIFSTNPKSAGTRLTIKACTKTSTEYIIINPHDDEAVEKIKLFLMQIKPIILNVAGNRESVSKGIAAKTASLMAKALIE